MLTVVLMHSCSQAQKQILSVGHLAEAYEFRLDTFADLDSGQLATLMELIAVPVIFTLRIQEQGGHFKGNYEERWKQLRPLLALAPSYVDLEEGTPEQHIGALRLDYPNIKLILSYHQTSKEVQSADTHLRRMLHRHADVYKIALYAHSALDALKMLHLSMQCHKSNLLFVGICMGEHGVLTRLLGPIIGSPFNYCCSESSMVSAPGQLSIQELCDVYHYKDLNADTKIYALLGHPVTHSPSHHTHNRLFSALKVNALYVKIDLLPEEFFVFFEACHHLPFEGFSITSPFKETAYQLFQHPFQPMHAINTLYKRAGKWQGANTDGIGAIRSLEEKTSLTGKKCFILGAGGSARAIAYTLLTQGAYVTIFNRTYEKALQVSASLGCHAASLEELHRFGPYDILINTTTVGMSSMEIPIRECDILPRRVVMDILLKSTLLLSLAHAKQCKIISGYDLFLHQAVEQFQLWLNQPLPAIHQQLKEYYRDFKASDLDACLSRKQ